MKKNITKFIGLLAIILSLGSIGHAQQISATQGQNGSEYNFEVANYTPSHSAVVLSHLWWFGDNGFSFGSTPVHTFSNNSGKQPSVIVTEGYGTGGPPPLRMLSPISSLTPIPSLRSLGQSEHIRIQNYRKAVAKDTVYFIITYAQPSNAITPSNGTITLELDNATTFLDGFVANNNHFLPNGETIRYSSSNPTQVHIDFTNIKNEERSILIPIYVGVNNKRNLAFLSSVIYHNNSEETFTDELKLPNRRSQDPNQMTEISYSDDNTSGDVYTPCEFGGEKIEYTIDFQNIGEGPTHYVQVVCQLDDKVDLNTIRDIIPPTKYNSINQVFQAQLPGANSANYYINTQDKTITFEFQDLKLFGTGDPLCQNLNVTKSSVSFSVNAKPDYVFGPPIISYSTIVFDENDALITDTVFTQCSNPITPGGFPNVAPSPTKPYLWIGASVLVALGGLIVFRKSKK
ncbi:MAG: hypothetical protein MK105_10525 [Crocinitomicaceae bacterium]|nr:hypothetical protein [Crocinitomicaceae bacterium]